MREIMAYLSVCFFWGSTFLAIRIGLDDFQPFMFAALRFLIAGTFIIIYSYLKGMKFPSTNNGYLKIFLSGVLMLMGGNGLVVFAEQWVYSGVASMIVTTIPIFIVIIESFILKQVRLTSTGYLGFIVSFIGVGVLSLGGTSSVSVDFLGVSILLIASISWASGSVYSKNMSVDCDIFPKVGLQMLGGFMGLITMSFLTGEELMIQVSQKGLYSLVYLVIFGSIIGYSSYIYILDKWSASKAGTYAYVNPIVAVLLGAYVLNEPLNGRIVVSMFAIIIGVILVKRGGLTIVTSSRD